MGELGDERASDPGGLAIPRVLVVDDEVVLAQAIARVLRRTSYDVKVAHSAESAIAELSGSFFDALILDLNLPTPAGWSVLERAMSLDQPPATIIITGLADINSAVRAMRAGASDFVAKPLDLADLRVRLERILETATMRRKLAALEARIAPDAPVVVSPSMKRVMALADRVASTPSSSALILGETGVGKEIVAERIHAMSGRRDGPYVKVNLAAIPEPLVESELFGSVRGAFTESKRDRAGLMASADGGTLLLDELCEFKVELQPKLLRALEERKYYPVGSDRERSVSVRVLGATNRDPEQAIASGRLREDLYFRLGTVIIQIPPLRERLEDIAPLAEHFLRRFSAELARPGLKLGREALAALCDHDWPGNVRELRNAVERAVMMTDRDVLLPDDFRLSRPRYISGDRFVARAVPPPKAGAVSEAASDTDADELEATGTGEGDMSLDHARALALERIEREHIQRVLDAAGGSRGRAAKLLGVSRTTLWEKLKRYGL